ncbi:hypothetical protein HZB60_00850 [candidate division KSB1 bacterium]|nr:hypothetical protein [candidate division KSB1 bacterium]
MTDHGSFTARRHRDLCADYVWFKRENHLHIGFARRRTVSATWYDPHNRLAHALNQALA